MNQINKFTDNISITYQENTGSAVIATASATILKLKNSLITIFAQYIGIKSVLASLIIMLSCLCLFINHFDYHYHPLSFQGSIIIESQVILLLFLGGFLLQKRWSRVGEAVKTLTIIYLLIYLMQFADTAIQITPFHLNDHLIYSIDQKLGFSTVNLLQWMHVHPSINSLTWLIYDSLIPLLIISPVIMAFLQENKAIEIFFTSILIAILLGYSLYYFFPTAGAPTGAIQSPYFTAAQETVLTQFNQIHHFQPVTHLYCGIIGFPSFHVIWAMLLAYLFRNRKYLFCVASLYSFLIILSALATGWHYLTDIFGGILVGALTLYLAEKCNQQF